jgi:hypothetical protein
VISEIEIRRASVFDLEEVDPESTSYGIYRFANRLHLMTREGVIRSELLIQEGDCFDEFLLQESIRALRGLEFLNQASAEVEALPDGSRKLMIRTQDDWTLEVSLGIAIDEGFTIEGLGVVEKNFLGTGTTLGWVRREDLESLENGAVGAIPRIPRTSLDASGEVGWTRTGWYADQMVRLPFRVETDHLAFRERARFRNDVFRYTGSGAEDFRYALLPFDLKDGDVAIQGRVGQPGRYWLVGGGLGWEDWTFPGYPGSVLEIADRDFDAGVPAAPETVALLLGQTEAQSALRLNLALGYRGMRYTQRRGLDAVDAEQDVPVGIEVLLSAGKSVGDFGRNHVDDAKSRLSVYYGADWGRFVLGSELDVEARSVDPQGGEREYRDVLSEVDFYLYTVLNDHHTVVTRASGARGTEMSRPFQLTLGGRDGVRGYSRDAFPGAESMVFSVEERWLLDWPNSEAADVSVTVFGDAGRMVAGEVPFGVDSGWRASVGLGLRLGFPSGSPKGRRIEFTYPLTGDRDQAVYFRYYEDVTGLLLGFADALMERTRWGGFRPELSR